jgi:protein-tyrosine kinase
MSPFQPAIRLDRSGEAPGGGRRPIGELICEISALSEKQIDQTLAHQRKSGLRFGEAAVALRFVEPEDVLHALSRQFQYTPHLTVPEVSSELVAAADPFGEQADAFRELRSRLMVEVLDGVPCALAVVSPDIGDGKSYLAANLAVSFSQLGESTLLIDADIHTPRQHRLLGVQPNRIGLTGVLAGFAAADGLVHKVPGLPHLHLAPAGAVPPNPLELLQRPVFANLVRGFVEQFDHVVVDSPAAVRGADSRVIAARSGAALVVARKGRSRMTPLEGLLDALSRGPGRIAGVVVNEH